MTEDDKNALKDFLRGAAGVIAAVLVAILVVGLTSWGNSVPDHEQSTSVVGTYKGCDIIQWHYGPLAEYQYFLHCNNTRPVYEQ